MVTVPHKERVRVERWRCRFSGVREDIWNTEGTEDTEVATDINWLTGQIVDAAMKVHTFLGPGCLESAYEVCLAHELRKRELRVETHVALPIDYDGVRVETGFRIDMLVQDLVIVELKAVSKVVPIHEVQLLTQLRLSHKRVGLVINFHAVHLKDGIKRVINGY
jgi:GxxExxY protein